MPGVRGFAVWGGIHLAEDNTCTPSVLVLISRVGGENVSLLKQTLNPIQNTLFLSLCLMLAASSGT